jgi:cystathionine beta-synthase
MNPEIRIIGADPEGSVLSGGSPKPWKVEGIGEDFVPRTFDSKYVDEWIRIGDAESFQTARLLARREGLLLGGSTGTNLAAALKYAQRLGPEHLVVVIGCDTGRNYLSKLFDDRWLSENKLTYAEPPSKSIGDLLRKRGPRELVMVAPDSTAAQAIDILEAKGISQLPVIGSDGKSVGSVQEVTLARVLHDGRDPAQVKVGDIMARPLPTLDVQTHLDEAYRLLLAGYTGVLATQLEQVVDIVTRIDLIHYWDQTRVK